MVRPDKDWYDPREFRRGDLPPSFPEPPTSRRESGWGRWLLSFAIGMALSLLALRAINTERFDQWLAVSKFTLAELIHPTRASQLPAPIVASPCGQRPAPASGRVEILDPAIMRRADTPFYGLRVTNRLASPLTMSFGAASGPVASLFLAAGQDAEFAAPAGDYAVSLRVGTQWCGGEADFVAERRINLSSPISVSQFAALEVTTDPGRPSGLSITRHERGAMTAAAPLPASAPVIALSAIDGIELPADPRGQYHVDGAINGKPIRFLVDTGASGVTMSREAANRAGLYHCRFTSLTSTANGPVEVCTADNVTVQFGPYRLDGMRIGILPYMSDDALLGMSALRHFRMEQSGGVLRISTHR